MKRKNARRNGILALVVLLAAAITLSLQADPSQ